MLEALLDANLGTAALTSAHGLLAHEITIFKDLVRVELQTTTPGISFESAWKKREVMNYQGQEFYVVSRQDLISLKLATGRDVDLEDVRLLKGEPLLEEDDCPYI